MRHAIGLLTTLVLLTASGCPAPTPPAPTPSASAAPAIDAAQRERAQAAAQALGKRLKQRLGEALSAGGPAEGIAACQLAAPEIAAALAAEQGLRVGRTSFRLRNPNNQAPAWAAASVAAQVAEPVFSASPEGGLQALLPIRTEGLCLLCHGAPADLDPAVQAALRERYPSDQATGFVAGELRGYFWVELPPAR